MSDMFGGAGGAAGSGGSGRATNGGARAATGPVPVGQSSSSAPHGVTTPTDIMRRRQQREAARQAEQQRKAEEERRRISAERRAQQVQAAGVAAPSQQAPQTGHRRTQSTQQGGSGDSGYATRQPAGTAPDTTGGAVQPPMQPTAAQQFPSGNVPSSGYRPAPTSQDIPPAIPRTSAAQSGAPRPAPPQQTQPSHARQPSTSAQPQAGPSSSIPSAQPRVPPSAGDGAGSSQRDPNVSSFPHAFERWEQLSSHWEGLTSYWIRRLEQNTEEVRREPLAQQMARQITDLSAAGANLFHAVVELQRLRASSERKFQRWFFETRAEQERAQEVQAEFDKQIMRERQARREAQEIATRAEDSRRKAEKLASETRRELQISKEEARRAWEELGRREQEERDRTYALREGQPIVIGGVQVFPTQHASRHGSVSHGPSIQTVAGGQAHGMPQEMMEQHGYQYVEATSPTDTDPFIEQRQALHHEPDVQQLGQPYPLGSTPATSGSTAHTAIPLTQAQTPQGRNMQPATSHAPTSSPQAASAAAASSTNPFYRHHNEPFAGGAGAYTTSAPPQPTQTPTSTAGATESYVSSPPLSPPLPAHAGGRPQGSASEERIETTEDDEEDEEEEYEMDSQGNLRIDAQGRPVPFRRGLHEHGPVEAEEVEGESSDDDVAKELEKERHLAQRYTGRSGAAGGIVGTGGPSYPAVPASLSGPGVPTTTSTSSGRYYASATSAEGQGQASPGAALGSPGSSSGGYAAPVDYEGDAYEGWEQRPPYAGSGYGGVGRHHYPTRLSDVIEEDERSRASPSRASAASRGF